MSAPSAITCPRCGYDLEGTRLADAEAGRTAGTCSECGLAFAWNELETGRLHTPRFSYEHGWALNGVRLVRTCGRSLTGWRLWGPLAMTHEIRPLRLVLLALVVLLITHCSAAALLLWGISTSSNISWKPASWHTYQATAWAASPVGPNRRVAPPPKGTSFLSMGQFPIADSESLALIAWPYRDSVLVWILGERIAINLHAVVVLGSAAPLLGPPFVLLLLRQTRRRFRLRKLHLLRAICLGTPMIAATVLLAQAMWFLGYRCMQNNWVGDWDGTVATLSGLACAAYWILWWWAFTRRYLRAPHALGIAAAGVVIAGLAFLIVGLVLRDGVLYSILA